MVKCPVCGNDSVSFARKSGVQYMQCLSCKCVYTIADISTIEKTQRDNELARVNQNDGRLKVLERFISLNSKVVDFGCGSGYFVRFMEEKDYDIIGIDLDTELTIDDIPDNSVDCFVLTEVIEHIASPHELVTKIKSKLKSNGIVYIETSFTDFCDDSYINPEIGHVLVHSHKSIVLLFKGFSHSIINRNVFIFRKK